MLVPRGRLSLVIPLCWVLLVASDCVFPNNNTAPDFPCDPDAEVSVCCGGSIGNVCLSNNLCRSAEGHTIRGSCTHVDFFDGCAPYCLSAPGGHDLISCYNSTSDSTSYCCGGQSFCCDNGDGRFQVLPEDPVIFSEWNDQLGRYVVKSSSSSTVSPTASSSTSTASASTSAESASTSTLSFLSSTLPLSSPTTTDAASPAADSQPASSLPPSSSELSTGAKAGIGVGATAGAFLLFAVGYLLWRMRKMEKAGRANSQQQYQQNVHEIGAFRYGGKSNYEGSSNMYPSTYSGSHWDPAEASQPHEVAVEPQRHELSS
ncbi:hypothetical protein F4778DRAFT_290116 [Xylariomycetidae sp. FL2044]|nr:hypothetical protein F4778DRAFT_290116 [Xylariomycetidae sp. FL2044]